MAVVSGFQSRELGIESCAASPIFQRGSMPPRDDQLADQSGNTLPSSFNSSNHWTLFI